MYPLLLTVTAFVITITILHELLHVVGYQLFKIPWRFKIITKQQIPIAFAIESDHFAGSFRNLGKAKQTQYSIIAGLPYVLIFPLCVLWSQEIAVIGVSVGVVHAINWPLEYGI